MQTVVRDAARSEKWTGRESVNQFMYYRFPFDVVKRYLKIQYFTLILPIFKTLPFYIYPTVASQHLNDIENKKIKK